MAPAWAAIAVIATVVGILALIYRPLGAYMARVYTTTRDLAVEKLVYRLVGVTSAVEQS